MPDPSLADFEILTPGSAKGRDTAFVERRRAQRRRTGEDVVAERGPALEDDRRLGPGRRLDDWRRKPEVIETEATETSS